MLAQIALATLIPLIPSVIGAPTKKGGASLSCVEYQYGGPFESFGASGFIHLYSNITSYDPDTETTAFNETRLGLSAVDGTIEPCGECRTTELFGFEVCQNSQRYGYNGLVNTPSSFYGHITYTNVSPNIQCLTASPKSGEGASLKLADCQYDFDSVGSSNQYFEMSVTDGVWSALLIDESDGVYGPNPDLNNNASLVLYDVIGPNKTFTYFGFKAPQF
ncbi:hypothetical protein IAR55_004240 [Kwoniella newhampshirensis]|uniref:Expansin-like EG45 domain-containing protein n=1 Tax=Kwoniella newhampshirensis TaxID=1651941 RepID=A0AAW0YWZ3_9TREE